MKKTFSYFQAIAQKPLSYFMTNKKMFAEKSVHFGTGKSQEKIPSSSYKTLINLVSHQERWEKEIRRVDNKDNLGLLFISSKQFKFLNM